MPVQQKLFHTQEIENTQRKTPKGVPFFNNKKIYCFRCNKRIFVWQDIKKKPWCCDCIKSLKEYFEKKNDTAGKDIRLCSCCKK